MKRALFAMVVVSFLLLPATVAADNGGEDDGNFSLRVNGDYRVAVGETIDALVVISGNASVEGVVTDALVVIDGTATVTGEIQGDITVIGGDLRLEETARVADVTLIRSDLVQAPGATVTGSIDRTRVVFSRGWAILFGVLFWVGMTLLVLASGVVFAAFGGRQLSETAQLMSDRPGPTILTGIVACILFPVVAVIALITVVGIPLGLTILLIVVPALIYLGYLVAGTWFGFLVLSRTPMKHTNRPYAPALLGLTIFQMMVLVPGFGGMIFILGAIWGSGAVLHRLRKGPLPAAAAPPATGEPAAAT